MLEGRDSAYPPSDAQLAAFYAQGVRVYGGYIKLGNDGLLNGWSQSDFDRVRAHGMQPVAYMSGWDDPSAAKAQAQAWGILFYALDDEGGIRPDGTWVPSWLSTADSGLYGNAPYHNGRTARFHVLAAYPIGGDPGGESWPSWVPRPATPCGWQWAGSHTENNITVDSSWFDDSFALAFTGAGGELSKPLGRVYTVTMGNKAFQALRGTVEATGARSLFFRSFDNGKWSDFVKIGGNVMTDDLGAADISPVVDTAGNISITVEGTNKGKWDAISTDGGATWTWYDTHGAGDGLIGVSASAPATATAGTPVDLSAVTQAAQDAKSAATAAQTAAQNAETAANTATTAAQNANSNAAAAAQGVNALNTKLDNAGRSL